MHSSSKILSKMCNSRLKIRQKCAYALFGRAIFSVSLSFFSWSLEFEFESGRIKVFFDKINRIGVGVVYIL